MPSERTQRRIDSLLDEAEEGIAQLDCQVVQSRAQAVIALEPANYLAAADRVPESSGNPPRKHSPYGPYAGLNTLPTTGLNSWVGLSYLTPALALLS